SQTADPDEGNNDATAAIEVVEALVEAIDLENGVPLTGLSGVAGESQLFRIEVPAGARHLRLTTYGGSGDVTLTASHDQPPTAPPPPAAGSRCLRRTRERPAQRPSIRASYTP